MTKFAFVITHFADQEIHLELFERTMRSLFAQSDPNWIAVVIDDASPLEGSFRVLQNWRARAPERIFLERTPTSGGAGAARNIAIRRASALGADVILLNDNDDLSHPERLARTRGLVSENPHVDFVYTGLRPIDGDDRDIPLAETRLDTVEIIEALSSNPPEGANVFAPMAAETGCLIIPSTAAIRTARLLDHPFPGGFASEDNHTWMRMAAAGAHFAFLPGAEIGYRIWRRELSDLGVNGRNRRFLWEKARNDIDGFERGVVIACDRGLLKQSEIPQLSRRFLARVAACVGRQGEVTLSARLTSEAFLSDLVARLPGQRAEVGLHLRPTG